MNPLISVEDGLAEAWSPPPTPPPPFLLLSIVVDDDDDPPMRLGGIILSFSGSAANKFDLKALSFDCFLFSLSLSSS